MTSNGRVARLTALALATGTLVAAGAGTAGATSTTKTTYTATGGGSVVRLTVNLPVALPGIGNTLTQDLVLTGSNVRTGDVAAAVTSSILGANGTVPVVSGLLDKSVTAEYGKPQPAVQNAFPDLGALGITGKLLSLESVAHNPNVDGLVAHSTSEVTGLNIDGAGNLAAVLNALTAQLQGIVNNVIGTLPGGTTSSTGSVTTPVESTVTGLLNTLTSQLDALTQNTTAPLSQAAKDAVNAVIAQLNALPDALSAKLKAQAANTSLLHVDLIKSEQSVTRAAGVVTSESDQLLTGISVLGGLITIDGLKTGATAALGNGLSKATHDLGQNALLHVNAANLLTVDVTSGLTAALGSTALPSQVTDAVNSALKQITDVLNGVLGATLSAPTADSTVNTADKAASTVAAARLVVNPTLPGLGKPLFAKPLLDVQFVPAAAEVDKAQSVTSSVLTTPAKATSAPTFAPTGANLPVTGAVAAALMGLAAIVRRRRSMGLAE